MKRDDYELVFQALAYAFGFGAGVYCMLFFAPIPWAIVRHAEVAALIAGALMYPVAHLIMLTLDAGHRRLVAWTMGRIKRLNRHERELARSGRKIMAMRAYCDRTGCTLEEARAALRAFDADGAA